MIGQKQQLLWDLPPMDSLRVNAAVYGIPDAVARRRINELADLLELGEELTRPVRKLSLGQRMKAELLAVLLHELEVLFLDEPTLGLDVNAQVRVRQFLAEYNRRMGATVLLTGHSWPTHGVVPPGAGGPVGGSVGGLRGATGLERSAVAAGAAALAGRRAALQRHGGLMGHGRGSAAGVSGQCAD